MSTRTDDGWTEFTESAEELIEPDLCLLFQEAIVRCTELEKEI